MVRRSFSRGCSVSLMVTPGCSFPTSWRSGMLGACVVRLWSHVVAPVFRELLCLGGCVPRCCFRIVFDSAGSAGVVFGPTLVMGRGITQFCYFFLLLWLVRDWLSLLSLVREAHPPTLFRWLAFQQGPSVSCMRALLLLLGCCVVKAERAYMWCGLHRCRVVVCRTVGVFARAKQMLVCCVAPLVERCDTYLWVLSMLYSFPVVAALPSGLRCIAWLLVFCEGFSLSGTASALVEVFRYRLAVVLVRLALKTWVSQNSALVVLVEVLPEPFFLLWSERLLALLVEVVFLFVFEFLSCAYRTSCVPVVGWFASLLVPCVLSQMVVWKRPVVCLLPLLSVGCSGWWCFHMAFGAVSCTVVTFVAKVVVTYCPVSCRAGSFCLNGRAVFGGTCRCLVCGPLRLRGGSGALGCGLLRANMVVALLKLLDFHVFLLWVSSGESLPFGLESFQALVSCGESFLLAMLFRPRVQLCCILPVCPVFEALSFPPLGHFVLVVPCGCTVTAVGFLRLHIRYVSLSDHENDLGEIEWCRWTLSYVPCQTTRMIWVLAVASCAEPFSGVLQLTSWCFPRFTVSSWDLCLVTGERCFLAGSVSVAPVELSTSDCVLSAVWGVLCELSDVCVATELPVATVIHVATSGCVTFLSRPVNGSRQPLPFLLRRWSLVERLAARVRSGSVVMERGGGGRGFVKAPLGFAFPMLSSPYGVLGVVVATPGCSVPAVYFPTDVATAVRVATSEEASPRSDATLSRRVSLVVTLGCSFLTSWRSGMLGACVVRLWSHMVALVCHELLYLSGCVPRCCFRIVFDSTGSAGVVFGLTLVVGRGITLFRCFVVLYSRLTALLSSGRNSLWQDSLPDGRGGGLFAVRCQQCELSMGGGMTFEVPGGASGRLSCRDSPGHRDMVAVARCVATTAETASRMVVTSCGFYGASDCGVLCTPFQVSGSVGGDRENRVLGMGRGSGSRGRYSWQVREMIKQQDESNMPASGQVQEEVSVEESVAQPQGAAAIATAGGQQQQEYQP
ncbi:hypothetical protein Taro_008991 [Colocasia esculenta]|uniref:Uncharacterized protein n=1 Tax=Colocasia esculenta TaxID=4460 RepID=A0A843U3T6_COLES|nr:hypothetical protein [Colocasia esculenta]